jgi:hypothetical protein
MSILSVSAVSTKCSNFVIKGGNCIILGGLPAVVSVFDLINSGGSLQPKNNGKTRKMSVFNILFITGDL